MDVVHDGVQVAKRFRVASSAVCDRVGNVTRNSEIHARSRHEEPKSSLSHVNGLRQRALRR
jgi:hypothetical protein